MLARSEGKQACAGVGDRSYFILSLLSMQRLGNSYGSGFRAPSRVWGACSGRVSGLAVEPRTVGVGFAAEKPPLGI